MGNGRTGQKKYWRNKRLMTVSRLLFIIYMMITLYVVFFAEQMGRGTGIAYRYNLVPFMEIKRFLRLTDGEWKWTAWFNLVGNILCFIPFGVFLPAVCRWTRTFVRTTILTVTFSMMIETIQLCLKIGIFDVDDLMLNTIGGMLGYCIYKIVQRFRAVFAKNSKVKTGGKS